jgi:hypothetical protein
VKINKIEKCPGCGGDASNNYFDRSFCPCDMDEDGFGVGVMHTRCAECHTALDGCDFEIDELPSLP